MNESFWKYFSLKCTQGANNFWRQSNLQCCKGYRNSDLVLYVQKQYSFRETLSGWLNPLSTCALFNQLLVHHVFNDADGIARLPISVLNRVSWMSRDTYEPNPSKIVTAYLHIKFPVKKSATFPQLLALAKHKMFCRGYIAGCILDSKQQQIQPSALPYTPLIYKY